MGDGRYEDRVLRPIIETAEKNVRKAFTRGVKIAPGSDAGAYRVLHGKGIQDEIEAFEEILGKEKKCMTGLQKERQKSGENSADGDKLCLL